MYVLRLVLLLACLLIFGGCGPVKTHPIDSYTLEGPEPSLSSSSATHLTLLVGTPLAVSGYDTSDMLYLTQSYRLSNFAYNRWVAPPANLMQTVVADHIKLKHYFRAVVTEPFLGDADYRLDIQLLALHQEFFTPISQVRLVVNVDLINNKTHRVVTSRRFEALVDAPGNNPYSGVVAANCAANSVGSQIASFVVGGVRKTEN